jgi:chromate transporter
MSQNKERSPRLAEATLVWLKIGLLSFGGPAAQIALMHRELVQQRSWLSEKRFLSGLSFCMLLPGPEAMQLATYSGWRLFGIRGGLVAGALFVIPGALLILALAFIYMRFGDVPWLNALFVGIKAAVLVIVVEALIRLYRRTSVSRESLLITVAAFVGIFFLQLSFPLILLCFACYGYFRTAQSQGTALTLSADELKGSVITLLAGLLCWWLPVVLLWMAGHELLTSLALFFSRLAVVTFGGAYAVLAYMAQDVVLQHQWLSSGEMMDALGLAETTPGPLILVTEFVAFVAAYHQGGAELAVAAAAIVLWVTFVPCFIWIFLGAPFIEWVSAHPRLKGALDAITAAVLGVMINLSLWFALHVLFREVDPVRVGIVTLWTPEPGSFNVIVAALTLLAAFLLLVRHWHVVSVLAVLGAAGLLSSTFI